MTRYDTLLKYVDSHCDWIWLRERARELAHEAAVQRTCRVEWIE